MQAKNENKNMIAPMIAPGIVLGILAVINGFVQFNVFLKMYCAYILIAVVVISFAILKSKAARVCMYVLLSYHILAMNFPRFYSILYPDNNMEEDIVWAVYNKKSLLLLFLTALMITFVFYLLNRFLWKSDSLWLCNIIIYSLVVTGIVYSILANIWSYTLPKYLIKSVVWIATFFFFRLLMRNKVGVTSKICKLSLLVSVILFPGIVTGITLIAKEVVKLYTIV